MIHISYIMVMWYRCVRISFFVIVGKNLKILIFSFLLLRFFVFIFLLLVGGGILGLRYGCNGTHQTIVAYLVGTKYRICSLVSITILATNLPTINPDSIGSCWC